MKGIIMAGGIGTRFWPRSTEDKPKQFHALTSKETMIQETYRRFRCWFPPEDIYVATTQNYLTHLRKQLPELDEKQLLIEPEQRDTGPCIALTALYFLQKGMDDVLVTVPADQYIPDDRALMKALQLAEERAQLSRSIVTLGIRPTRPETAYGYIEAEDPQNSELVLPVKAFVEKPTLEKANELIKRKNMYWNSGIFIWKPSTIGYYMNKHQPVMWQALSGGMEDVQNVYPLLPKISVDYAILEKADQIYCIPVQFPWDDVGSWKALERFYPPDENGNLVIGDVSMSLTQNSIVYAEQKTVILGVSDLIIASTSEGVLVCHKSMEQQIKTLIQRLEQ